MSTTSQTNELRACLVISHYNAWPTDQLIRLLDQSKEIPSGHPFRTRVVVNQAVDKRLELPERHADVEVYYRPNTGYNIGAWDHGWRHGGPFDFYLFLQEECIILKRNWMEAFLRSASDPRTGLVGESLTPPTRWESWRVRRTPICNFLGYPVGSLNEFVNGVLHMAASREIDPGKDTRHLQSLVLGARREVLERIDGFISWPVTYHDAVTSEILISKAVLTAGWDIKQLGWLPFSVVSHPQWKQSPLRAIAAKGIWRLPLDIRFATHLVVNALQARARRTGVKIQSTVTHLTTSVLRSISARSGYGSLNHLPGRPAPSMGALAAATETCTDVESLAASTGPRRVDGTSRRFGFASRRSHRLAPCEADSGARITAGLLRGRPGLEESPPNHE